MVIAGMYERMTKNKAFRDFVCTRLQNVTEINKPIATIQARVKGKFFCDGGRDKLGKCFKGIGMKIYPTPKSEKPR